jgi:5-methylcytosine-specific restriction protein A
MIEWLKSWFIRKPVGQARSGQWARVRRQHLERWNWCAACGRKDNLEAHHIVPFFIDPTQELTADNIITLCRTTCHLLIGHLGDWSSYNPQVRADADRLLQKIKTRPER